MKSGRFLAREAQPGELILTVVAGKLETIKRAETGEIVIQNIMLNSSAERYVVDGKKFPSRYEATGEVFILEGVSWGEYLAKGIIEAIQVTETTAWHDASTAWMETHSDEPFAIIAPWGEEMVVQEGDWIARPILADLSVPTLSDIYRIEATTFKQTYAPFTSEDAARRLRISAKA